MGLSEHEEVEGINEQEPIRSPPPLPYIHGSEISRTRKVAQKSILVSGGTRKRSPHQLFGLQKIAHNLGQYDPFHDGWVQNFPQDYGVSHNDLHRISDSPTWLSNIVNE